MRKMKFISASFFTGLLLVAGLVGCKSSTTDSTDSNSLPQDEAEKSQLTVESPELVMEDDDTVFGEENFIPYEDLSINIRQSSTTSSTQAIDFTLASQVETYCSNRPIAKYCKFRITDMEGMPETQLKFDSDKCISYDIENQKDLDEKLAEIKGKTDEETEKLRKTFIDTHGFIADKPVVTGEVYLITGVKLSSKDKTVYVPKQIRVADFFTIKIEGIGRNVFNDIDDSNKAIEEIHIPDTITSVATDAFKGLNEDAKIIAHYVGPEEGESDPRLQANYAPEKVMESIDYVGEMVTKTDKDGNEYEELDGKYSKEYKKYLDIKQGGSRQYFGTGKTFIVGVYDENKQPVAPLYVHFDLADSQNNVIGHKKVAVPLQSITSETYDKVDGSGLELKVTVDIYGLKEGEQIIDKSIKFSNIYVLEETDNVEDEVEKIINKQSSLKPSWANGAIKYNAKLDLSDFIKDYSYAGMSTYNGYTNIKVDFHFDESKYIDLKRFVYADNSDKIFKEKTHHIRFRIGQLHKMVLSIDYENNDGELVHVPFKIPVDGHNTNMTCEKDGVTSFLVKNSDVGEGFDAYSLRNITFKNFTLWVDIFSETTGAAIHSALISRFSNLEVIPEKLTAAGGFDYNITNGDLIIILVAVITVIAYVSGSVGLFFYKKAKYKNDEFKRVNPRKYLKSAILGGLGTLLTVIALTYIILRFSIFANTVIVFNPMDAILIGMTVVDIIVIGAFIKMLVQTIKTNRERRRNIKLKIDDDVVDDGTK